MKLFRKLRAFFRKEKLDAEMAEEMRAHLELQVAENIAHGMSAAEARYAARRQFGSVEQIKEQARDARGFAWLEQFVQDVRYGARQLRRNPSFTAFAALSLGLGIGVNVIVFSLVNAVVFRPLPGVRDSQELVYRHPMWGWGMPYPEFELCRDHNTAFSAMTASVACRSVPTLADPAVPPAAGGAVEYLGPVQLVSGNYFSVMHADLALGRGFLPEEDRVPGACPVMILSHQYWQERFNSDPGILGRTLLVNQVLFTVVGVTREAFPFEPGMLRGPSAWLPMMMAPVVEPTLDRLHAHQEAGAQVYFFGRLKPGVTFAQAQAELASLDAQYAREFLPFNPRRLSGAVFLTHGFAFFPWDNDDTKTTVIGGFGLTGIVLLVACANVANLLLARATTRQREISVRLALGASRGRIVRQLLTESLMIAGLGGAGAMVLGAWCGELLWPWLLGLNLTPEMHRFFGLDWHVAAYALLLAVATGVVFGLVPALEAARSSIHAGLKQESTVLGRRISRTRLRGILVTAQVAISVTFLLLASLTVRMILRNTALDLPFDPKRICFFEEDTPAGAYAAQHPREFQAALLEQIRALPGVKAASLGDVWYGKNIDVHAMLVDGQTTTASGANESRVAPEFFTTIGLPVVRGRVFTEEDAKSGAPVLVVSETFARQFWPGQDPLGHRLKIGRTRDEGEIIGVVKDGVRMIRSRYEFRPFVGDVYSPISPASKELFEVWVRTETDPEVTMRAVMEQARRLDPDTQIRARGTLNGIFEAWRNRTLTVCTIVATLGGLALLLAGMGVYGVMSYAVAQRTHEIGVRMALGAEKTVIARMVLREGLRLVGWGVGVGALGCAALSWLARALLYGLSPLDPVAFGGISLLLTVVTLAACWFPARRAAKVDPMVALRCE